MTHTMYRFDSVPRMPIVRPRILNDAAWPNSAAKMELPPATYSTPMTPNAAWYAYSSLRWCSSCVISVPSESYASSVVSRHTSTMVKKTKNQMITAWLDFWMASGGNMSMMMARPPMMLSTAMNGRRRPYLLSKRSPM
jgi:hypothetical protein